MWISETLVLSMQFTRKLLRTYSAAEITTPLTLHNASQTLFNENAHTLILLHPKQEPQQINTLLNTILLTQIPAVEILLDCTQGLAPTEIKRAYRRILAADKSRAISLLVDYPKLSEQFLGDIAQNINISESNLAIWGTGNITTEFIRYAYQIAQKMHFRGLELRFFTPSPDWLSDPLPVLKTHLGSQLRLSRLEDFSYKEVTHLELANFGIRFEVWKNLDQQSWHRIKNYGWIATKFLRQEKQRPTLNILPSNICNARCPYCVSDVLGRKSTQLMPMNYDKLNLASEFVKRRGGQIANISGGGEPTLAPNLPESVKLLSKHFNKIVLHTNGGFLLTPYTPGKNLLEALAASGLTGISLHRVAVSDVENFSLMGLPEIYNINDLVASVHNSGLNIQLSCVLLKDHIGTLESVKQFLEWATDIQVDKVIFRQLLKKLPASTKSKTRVIAYCNTQRIPISLIESFNQQDDHLEFIKEEPWGECGMEHLFQYTSFSDKKVQVRILHGAWYQSKQTNSQVSGFVFRAVDNQWGLYAGWITQSDQVLH